jgi:hypothetical protein
MRDAGLHRDDPLDHMWFPVLRRTTIDAAVAAPPGQPVAR